MAIRSGEPYRIQIYEFLHALAQGGVQSQFSDMHISNGEDQGASGTGLGSLLSPMLKVLDDMDSAPDDLIKCVKVIISLVFCKLCCNCMLNHWARGGNSTHLLIHGLISIVIYVKWVSSKS